VFVFFVVENISISWETNDGARSFTTNYGGEVLYRIETRAANEVNGQMSVESQKKTKLSYREYISAKLTPP